ncbi:MAG TPA: hypothetical protein VHN14_14755 [Kofleriaceae bacterium]|jgi:hypothetical protein|nr:hypothetical protein [Kofleriaceae bacterium]
MDVQLRRYSPEAAEQVERAASSIVLHLAEGGHRHGHAPRPFWDLAHDSAGVIRGALDLADPWGWGWQVERAQARARFDRELGLLWGLIRHSPQGGILGVVGRSVGSSPCAL